MNRLKIRHRSVNHECWCGSLPIGEGRTGDAMNDSVSSMARTPGILDKLDWHFWTRWAKLYSPPRTLFGDAAIWVILSAGLEKRSIYTPNCLKWSMASLGGPLKIM